MSFDISTSHPRLHQRIILVEDEILRNEIINLIRTLNKTEANLLLTTASQSVGEIRSLFTSLYRLELTEPVAVLSTFLHQINNQPHNNSSKGIHNLCISNLFVKTR
jgi:hypothetical protein